jgi:hypothetical protein
MARNQFSTTQVVDTSMKQHEKVPEFSLLGGPLHQLGCRLGLVRSGTNTVRLGVALGLLAWGVLMALVLFEGFGPKVFSLRTVAVPVRFLIVTPLFFLCETWVVPQMAEFVRYIVRAGLVPEASLPALTLDIRRVGRMKDSWLAELLLLLAAVAVPLLETITNLPGGTSNWASTIHAAGGKLNWSTGWYLGFCLPLFRFLLLRCLWRLGLWYYFLWRIDKLDLRLTPTHSDGAGGLGYLEIVQEYFTPLVLALSALYSALFAEEIVSGRMAFESLYSLVPMLLLLDAALFIGPLLIFSRKLMICRWTGMSKYMGMAASYVDAFDAKWIQDDKASGESQLGSADLQSLADLTNSVNVVRGMRWIPAGQRLLVQLAVCALAPLAPLLLLKFPVDQMAAQLFRMLTGL